MSANETLEAPNRRDTDVADPIFEIRDATVTFDMDRGESRVLDRVSLTIERDEILGIVGESGSGKSMFASSLLDAVVEPGRLTGDVIYYPRSGHPVNILDFDSREMSRYRWEEVSMVFQGAMNSFNPTMKIGEHFRETLDAHDRNERAGMERASELLSDLYLNADRVLDSFPHELSGGMRQRTLIALSLVLEPKALVMDEPTAALDLLMQRSIIKLLMDIKDKYDITLVFITHDLPLVAELVDRLAVMYAFEFVEIGPIDDILGNAAHPYTRALLNATPSVSTPIEDMNPIVGSSPDPVNVPVGCSFHPRCPLADEYCAENDPGYRDVTTHHRAKCFYWEQAEEAIPISFTAEFAGDDR